MEQVLEVYCRPYDASHPVICMDEQPRQLIDEVRPPVATQPGTAAKEDFEYVRHGMCVVWMFVEPLAGWRSAPVSERKTAVDWALQVRAVVEAPRYAQAERITLVCDNLNTIGWPRCMRRLRRRRRYGWRASWNWCIHPNMAVGSTWPSPS
jgi:hypothetical protein